MAVLVISHGAEVSAAGQHERTCIVRGLAALLVVWVHSRVVVGGVLRPPLHGILGVLRLWVLCQVAGCIRNVVHATFTHSSSSCHIPGHSCPV